VTTIFTGVFKTVRRHFKPAGTFVISALLVAQSLVIPSATAAVAQNSFCFDGNQTLTLTTNTNLPTNNDSYTIETWIKTTQASGKGSIAGWGVGSSQASNAFTTLGSGFYHWWWGNDLNQSSAGTNIKNGSWHHIAAQFNGTTRSVYLDGTLVGSDSPGLNHVVTTISNFAVGGFNNEKLIGCLSNLRIVKGVAVYTGNFTVPTSPLEATQSAGTNIAAIPSGATVLLLNDTSNFLQDKSSYGYLLTNNGSVTSSTDGPALTSPRTTTSSLTDTVASRSFGVANTLTATVLETGTAATTATGTFAFKNNGATISGCGAVAITSGVATCSFTQNAKNISLTAVYSGNATFGISTSAAITYSVPVVMSDGTSTCSLELSGSYFDSITVAYSGIYCFAAFKGADTYTAVIPAGVTSVDYLVVGGGGGGGSGGGGAGGLLQGTNYSVTPGASATVKVGAGGAGGNGGAAGNGVAGTNGGNSVFTSLTAIGGGGGGSALRTTLSGGSGGGSTYDCTGSGGTCGKAGTGTVGQGNNGGYSTYNSYGGGAGGGGAGGAGYNTTRTNIGGNGGVGATSSLINSFAAATSVGQLSGGNYYLAAGGGGGINSNDGQYVGLNASSVLVYGGTTTAYTNGGGQGGIGGGGRGSSFGYTGGTAGQYANATAGAANSGSGGGGTDPEDIKGGAGGSGVVLLRWVAATNLKSITFNSNYSTPETSTQRVTSGASTLLNAGTFSRTGYIFAGWTANADGTGTSFADSSYITTSADITLYAKWITGVNKTITFNGNSSTSGSMSAQSAGKATAVNVNTYIRTNYTFTGWNTAANGSGYAYADGAVYAFTTDATLYAQWLLTRTPYTVTFYANAVDATGTTASQTNDTTTALTLSGFSRPGHNFLGWHASYNSASASYLDGQIYAFTADANLYAIWVAQAPNLVTFDKNAVDAIGTTSTQTASSSTTLNLNGYSRSGYTFLNWNTAANGSGTNYQSTYTYSFAAAITLYASWSQNLTISYSGNGATSGDTPTAQSYYAGGPRLTVSSNAGNLARTGYTLVGWNTAANGSGTAYAIGGANAAFTGNTTLYAQWLGATYPILYTGNGNTSGSAPAGQSFVYGGSAITLRANSSSLARAGYEFNGWNSQPDGSGTAYAESQAGVTFSNEAVLFAQWSGGTYTITYNANTGTVASPSATFAYGSSLTLLTPTKLGYAFQGWFDSTTAGSKIADGGASYSAALSRTLYAQWAIASYTITYNANGGSVDTSTVTYTYGDSAIALRVATRPGYELEGWYTASTGGTLIGDGAELHTPTATRTLYAQWTQLSLVGLGSATKINSNTTLAGVGTSFSASSGGTSVTIAYVADALPPGTVIDVYILPNTTRAAQIIGDTTNLLLSLVVAWKAADGTVPSTADGSPISITITNSSIKAGAKIYGLIGPFVELLGTATVDGSVTVTISDDPEIVIDNPAVVTTPSSGGGSSGGESSGAPAVTAPTTPTPTTPTTPAVTAPTTPTPTTPATPAVTAPTTPTVVTTPAVTPTAPTTPIAVGRALIDVRDASGAVVSTVKSVLVSPVDPNALVVSLASAQVTVLSVAPTGVPNPIQKSTLTITPGAQIKISADGFLPNSEVSVYVFSTPILLGKVITDAEGRYSASLASPPGLKVGSHTVQLIGFLKDKSLATLSLPVSVVQPTFTKTIKSYFEMNSGKITPGQMKLLKSALAKVNKKKIVSLSIKGFAQKTGSQGKDQRYIRLRAVAVAKALKTMGIIAKPLISGGGYAVEKDARARRVEIVLKLTK
jgi:uncharacterized repeat protein (TIGR02543 family)